MKFLNVIFIALFITGMVSCKDDKQQAKEARDAGEAAQAEGEQYNIDVDPIMSLIHWRGEKVTGDSHYGELYFKEGSLFLKDSTVVAGNFVTDNLNMSVSDEDMDDEAKQKLIDHFISDEMFNFNKYPNSTFDIVKVEKNTEGDFSHKVTGNLKIWEITKEVTFNANIKVDGEEVTFNTEEILINRKDYGVEFDSKLSEAGLRDEMTINISSTFTKPAAKDEAEGADEEATEE